MIAIVCRNRNRGVAAIPHDGRSRRYRASIGGGSSNLVLVNRKYWTNGVTFRYIREGIAGHRRYAQAIHQQTVKVIALVGRNAVSDCLSAIHCALPDW